MAKTKKKLGEILLEAGLIDELQLISALAYQRDWGERLGSICIKKGFVSEQDVIAVIEKQLGLACISLEGIEKPPDKVLKTVKVDIAKKYGIFPVRFEGKTLLIATSDPTELKALDDISFMLGVSVKPLLVLESDVQRAIELHYEKKPGLDRKKIAAKVSRSMPHDAGDKTEPKGTISKVELSQKTVIESIVDLLIAKGIFTKEELINHIKSRKQL